MAEKAPRQFHLATTDGRGRTRLTSLIEIFRQITFRFLCAPPSLSILDFLLPSSPERASSFSPLKTEEEEAHSIFVESTQEEGMQPCTE